MTVHPSRLSNKVKANDPHPLGYTNKTVKGRNPDNVGELDVTLTGYERVLIARFIARIPDGARIKQEEDLLRKVRGR